MNILADECCPLRVVEALRADGHDVWYAANEASGSPDADLLARSVAEARVLLTEDHDFCEMIYRDARPAYAVVLVRIPPTLRAEKVARVRTLFAEHSSVLPGTMATLTLHRIRLRPLPAPPEHAPGKDTPDE